MEGKVSEAPLRQADGGLTPDGDGWFIVNIGEAQGLHSERFGDGVRFEGSARFPEFGMNVRVLSPGQPSALYHREDAQEAFLVLVGRCLAIVEDEEREMERGDFLYSPAGTAHVLLGAGEGPCVILMVGARKPRLELQFPRSEVAARHGAASQEETTDVRVAYAGTTPPAAARVEVPL